jgi:hypothetical protein
MEHAAVEMLAQPLIAQQFGMIVAQILSRSIGPRLDSFANNSSLYRDNLETVVAYSYKNDWQPKNSSFNLHNHVNGGHRINII